LRHQIEREGARFGPGPCAVVKAGPFPADRFLPGVDIFLRRLVPAALGEVRCGAPAIAGEHTPVGLPADDPAFSTRRMIVMRARKACPSAA
jgi:hypothetical protein